MKILLTGATGMVGQGLLRHLQSNANIRVRAALRRANTEIDGSKGIENVVLGDINATNDFTHYVLGMDVVVHAAARVHVMNDAAVDPLVEYRKINTEGTLNLARQAAFNGVKRFIFLSTIKVNGEATRPGSSFSKRDQPMPQDAYAISKWEAEQGLFETSAKTGMEVVILRAPLVYGQGVGANFLRLMRAVDKRTPLPFGLVDNCRSLIYLGNLVDAIVACLDHPAAAGKTYLLSDGEDVSTPELINRLAKAFNRSPRLLPIPPVLIRWGGQLFGKGLEIDRLLGSLVVDSSAILREMGWMPPHSMQEGLQVTASWYREKNPYEAHL